jgi:hypothetical protein
MFENQCAQFVGCLYGSALNRGPDPFYANGNLAGSAFKKAGRSLRKWMADGSVYQTEQAASILPLCRPLCLSEQQGLEKTAASPRACGSREAGSGPAKEAKES